jgi:TonB family protein
MRKIYISFIVITFLFSTNFFAQTKALVHAEEMPYFSGCEKYKYKKEKKRVCSNETMVSFLAFNVDYPAEAMNAGTEGTVYVSFIIDEAGRVIEPSIIRDIGHGCGAAAIDVLNKMPKWEPGKDKGEIVKVKLNLPIHFYLKNGVSNPLDSDGYKITWGTLKGNKITVDDLKANLEKIIMVRDRFGDPVSFDALNFSYQRKKNFKTATSNGILNKKQKKIVKKAKAGGKFYLEVVVHDGNKKIKVGREFGLVE